MNTSVEKLTLRQERIAYRRAVKKTLSVFFHKTPQEAAALVSAWWDAMGHGDVYKTAIFMHDEPANTAADLAGVESVPSIRDLGEPYKQIIRDSMPKHRTTGRKHPENQSRTVRAA